MESTCRFRAQGFLRVSSRYREAFRAGLARRVTRAELNRLLPAGFSEVELDKGRWDELIRAGMNWKDILALLDEQTVVWISRNVYIYLSTREDADFGDSDFDIGDDCFSISVAFEGGGDLTGTPAVVDRSISDDYPQDEYKKISQIVAQTPAYLVGVSTLPLIAAEGIRSEFPMSAETFAYYLEQNRNNNIVAFHGARFSTDLGRLLSAFPGRLQFYNCSFEDGMHSILNQVSRSQGPTELHFKQTEINFSMLLEAISQSRILRSLCFVDIEGIGIWISEIFGAVKQNRSLTAFAIYSSDFISAEEWVDALWSLREHETLEKLMFLVGTLRTDTEDSDDPAHRIRLSDAVVDLLKANKVLFKVQVYSTQLDESVLEEEIRPRLKANLFRKRIKAMMEESNPAFRSGLFSSALLHHEINPDPSVMWLLLESFHEHLPELHESANPAEAPLVLRQTRNRKRRRPNSAE